MARKANNKAPALAAVTASSAPAVGAGEGGPAEGALGSAHTDAYSAPQTSSQDPGGAPPAPASASASSQSETVPARVLRDCWLGAAGQIIELDAACAKAVEASGAVDLHPQAVVNPAQGDDAPIDDVIEDDED